MSNPIHIDVGDEIADLVDTVKNSPDSDVTLVLPPNARAFQTPLNVRLLGQFAKTNGKNVSIVSEDPRIQQMSRTGGFPTYNSIPAAERGIETELAHWAIPASGAALATAGNGDAADEQAAATAASPPDERVDAHTPVPPARIDSTTAGRRRDRKPIYFAGVAVAVIGLLLFLFVAPSARLTVTIAATPLSANPVIQGTTDAKVAKQGDHILTQVASDTETTKFAANPTGSKQLPATAATGSIQIKMRVPFDTPFAFAIPAGTEFATSGSSPQSFVSIADATVNFPANPSGADFSPASVPVPVQARVASAASNVPSMSINKWPQNLCEHPQPGFPPCSASDYQVFNSAATSGGVDAKTVVIASPQDITNFQNQLTQSEQQLTAKVSQAIVTKTNGKTLAKDPSGGGATTNCSGTPALPSANDEYSQTQITVTCQGTAVVYGADDIKAALLSDLNAQVPQGEQLVTNQVQYAKPQITQAGTDGTVIISAKATGYSRPAVDFDALKPQLTGKSPGDVRKILQGRVGPVVDVQITQTPFGMPVLPFFTSRITFDVKYQSQKAS